MFATFRSTPNVRRAIIKPIFAQTRSFGNNGLRMVTVSIFCPPFRRFVTACHHDRAFRAYCAETMLFTVLPHHRSPVRGLRPSAFSTSAIRSKPMPVSRSFGARQKRPSGTQLKWPAPGTRLGIGGGASNIIHAAGVRVGFSSSAPKARTGRGCGIRGYRAGVGLASLCRR